MAAAQKRINDSDVAGAAKEVSDFAKTLPDGSSLKVDVCTVATALDRWGRAAEGGGRLCG